MAAPHLKLSTGVLISDGHLVVTTVSKSPFGFRQIATCEVEFEPGEVAAALTELNTAGLLKGKVVCGLDGRRVYSITRRQLAEDHGQTPAEVLSERLGHLDGGLVAGMTPIKLPSGPHAVMVACSRGLARQVLAGLGKLRKSATKLVPLVPTMYRMAVRAKSSPRKWRTEVRVLFGEQEGLAILAHADVTLASRLFEVAGDNLESSLDIAIQSLLTYVREDLGLDKVDGITLHREDTDGLAGRCGETFAVPTVSAPPVAMDEHAASTALAQSGLLPTPGAVDLFGDLRPAAGLKENFPKRAAALLLGTLAAAGWMLHEEASRLERDTARTEQQVAALAKRVKITSKDVKVKHVAVEAEWNAATAFVVERVFWGEFLAELPDILPGSVTLTDFNGKDKVQFKKKTTGSAATRQLIITGQVPLDGITTSPPEVSMITDAIRDSAPFQREFARVTGANVRLMPGMSGAMARLVFVCLPTN